MLFFKLLYELEFQIFASSVLYVDDRVIIISGLRCPLGGWFFYPAG